MKIYNYIKASIVMILSFNMTFIEASDVSNNDTWTTVLCQDFTGTDLSEFQDKLQFGERIRFDDVNGDPLWKDMLPWYEFALRKGVHIEISHRGCVLDITYAAFLRLPVTKVDMNISNNSQYLESSIRMQKLGNYTSLYAEVAKDGRVYIAKDIILNSSTIHVLQTHKVVLLLRIDPEIKLNILFPILYELMNHSTIEGFLIVK